MLIRFFTALPAALLLTACMGDNGDYIPTDLTLTEVPLVYDGSGDTFLDNGPKLASIIRSQQDLDGLMANYPYSPAASVNFASKQALLVYFPSHTAGLGMVVDSLKQYDGYAVVNIHYTHLANHCVVNTVIEGPQLQLFSLPTLVPVYIQEQAVVVECE
ncbi:hypothetical protein ACQUQU_18340 [Thalassolituus sp. LLYu03]|uniref:hypothetical protein n=1 Tax=Thalassolituus sp. LLYu03 TaxID=3421656 RepID=UPI003D2DCE12